MSVFIWQSFDKLMYNLQTEQTKIHVVSACVITDFLSRSGVKTEESIDKTMHYMVHCVGASRVDLSEERFIQFKQETESDVILGEILTFLKNGWPNPLNWVK